jgi:flagellar biosynthesis/type III secretory pathway protein FliH
LEGHQQGHSQGYNQGYDQGVIEKAEQIALAKKISQPFTKKISQP